MGPPPDTRSPLNNPPLVRFAVRSPHKGGLHCSRPPVVGCSRLHPPRTGFARPIPPSRGDRLLSSPPLAGGRGWDQPKGETRPGGGEREVVTSTQSHPAHHALTSLVRPAADRSPHQGGIASPQPSDPSYNAASWAISTGSRMSAGLKPKTRE
jgi:hypothetical protein